MIRLQRRDDRANAGSTATGTTSPEIGSDFENVHDEFLLAAEQTPPWEQWGSCRYVESGRQALAAVEEHLRRQGHRTVYVPSYLCDSMIQPFVDHGWSVTPLPVGDELAVRARTVAQLTHGVLLHAKYFGSIESEGEVEALDIARRRGVVVVSDETHRVFSSSCVASDLRIASLRKLLPIPHGGYVWGLPNGLGLAPPQDSRALALRCRAMAEKSRALRTADGATRHRALFAAAEDHLVARRNPTELTEDIVRRIRRLDLTRFAVQRLGNARALRSALVEHSAYDIIGPAADGTVPSHIVLRTQEPHRLREHLRRQRIYCPIHWPPSQLLPLKTWPTRYLSIPIDHRYTRSHMDIVATTINDYFHAYQGTNRSVSDSRT